MGLSRPIRVVHRWVSIVFAAVVIMIFAMLGLGHEPVEWVYYLPLPPLAFLLITGLYMFFRPYVRRRAG
ncbi:hypothetical protein [Sphingomonas sp.]|uniref:hypothetical protein n=1 Tax=Sphingomonas sp. TaxID=28214 RepID=UPI002EDB6633